MMKKVLCKMLLALMALSLVSCKKEPVYPMDGGPYYGGIYLYVGGAVIDAHESVFECPATENTVTFKIVSPDGLNKVEIIEGEDFSSVQEKPSFPPATDEYDIYEYNDGRFSKYYIQTVSVHLRSNMSSNKSRKSVLRVESPVLGRYIAEISILQKGNYGSPILDNQ